MVVRRGNLSARGMALACLVAFTATPASAATSDYKKGLQNAGEITAIALPLAAGTVALFKNDWGGIVQLGAVSDSAWAPPTV